MINNIKLRELKKYINIGIIKLTIEKKVNIRVQFNKEIKLNINIDEKFENCYVTKMFSNGIHKNYLNTKYQRILTNIFNINNTIIGSKTLNLTETVCTKAKNLILILLFQSKTNILKNKNLRKLLRTINQYKIVNINNIYKFDIPYLERNGLSSFEKLIKINIQT